MAALVIHTHSIPNSATFKMAGAPPGFIFCEINFFRGLLTTFFKKQNGSLYFAPNDFGFRRGNVFLAFFIIGPKGLSPERVLKCPKAIIKVDSSGFESLTHEEQITRAWITVKEEECFFTSDLEIVVKLPDLIWPVLIYPFERFLIVFFQKAHQSEFYPFEALICRDFSFQVFGDFDARLSGRNSRLPSHLLKLAPCWEQGQKSCREGNQRSDESLVAIEPKLKACRCVFTCHGFLSNRDPAESGVRSGPWHREEQRKKKDQKGRESPIHVQISGQKLRHSASAMANQWNATQTPGAWAIWPEQMELVA